jgi:transposase
MRHALSDAEWRLISPILPRKPRGVPRVDDRRVLNGIFWVLRSGAPWRDQVVRFFNRIKHCRRIATRYEKHAVNFLAFVKLAAIRLWLRAYESTA